jgi:wobble nucleotide-excising tRNase
MRFAAQGTEMIKSIQRIRKFGVFEDFSKTAALSDFVDKNIIYGWNYSGKTTLSRLFAMLTSRTLNVDFSGATFSILDHQNQSVTDATLSICTKVVEVFNSDFVASNLSWTGSDFQPILLLGKDAAEAEKKIAPLNDYLLRCRNGFAAKKEAIAAVDDRVAEAKTAGARHIKTNLQLVDAFTAVHLTNEISGLGPNLSTAQLTDAQYADDIKLALTAEKDKLKSVAQLVPPQPILPTLLADALTVLAAKPSFSKTIDYLRTNKAVSDWVECGLVLHVDKKTCEFCGGDIAADRIAELHGHFSQDLLNHKAVIAALESRVEAAILKLPQLEKKDFAPQFSVALAAHNIDMKNAVEAYNRDLESILSSLRDKLSRPFDEVDAPLIFPSVSPFLTKTYQRANATIKDNNQISDDFSSEKKKAIQRLKRHFASQFCTEAKLVDAARAKELLGQHMHRFQTMGVRLKEDIAELYARIDRSQRGRERLNERIATLLGSGSIEITVVKVDDADRFQLTRRGVPARNLSDGERTAIAFAFFLTKLEEHKDLAQVIVYIDDPISSLDSNHVFQVYSMIESVFFKKVPGQGDSDEWVTACKQIFISTHNFEFFELLKKLPCSKKKTAYFMIRRLSPMTSTLENLPVSMMKYTSEYHYLFSVIHAFHVSPDKANIEHLLSLPNAMRRFVELYTYMKLPLPNSTVDQRAEELFGREKTHRITKLLHHFSHLESIERLATNTNLIADIEAVVEEVMTLVKEDRPHFDALQKSLPV